MRYFIVSCLIAAAAAAAAAAETGCVYSSKGDVQLLQPGAGQWAPARKGSPVAEGARLRTGHGASCELFFKDGTFVTLDEESETAAETLKAEGAARTFSFDLLRGKALWLAAKAKAAAAVFKVHTPAAVCAVRGTAFAVQVSSAGETSVGLFEGAVDVSSGEVTKQLAPGSEAVAAGGSIAVQARLSRLMKAEQRRYGRVKARVDALRARLAERDGFIDDYISRQDKAVSGLDSRRREKLQKRK